MMLLDVPALLALAAAALAALAVAAPARVHAVPPVSFAPPPYVPPPPPVERWAPTPPLRIDDVFGDDDPPQPQAAWPALVDARAADCDAATRCTLAEALAAVRAPWAEAILDRALRDEHDDTVRAALARARQECAATSP